MHVELPRRSGLVPRPSVLIARPSVSYRAPIHAPIQAPILDHLAYQSRPSILPTKALRDRCTADRPNTTAKRFQIRDVRVGRIAEAAGVALIARAHPHLISTRPIYILSARAHPHLINTRPYTRSMTVCNLRSPILSSRGTSHVRDASARPYLDSPYVCFCSWPCRTVLAAGNMLRELRGLWRLRRKVYCYERGYEPYIYELCVSTDVGSRQTLVRLRWAVEVEIDYWVP
jgi:hypothetical protein